MLDQLESNYDCSNASSDLPKLLKELDELKSSAGEPKGDIDSIHRLENQIAFIRNKCRIQ